MQNVCVAFDIGATNIKIATVDKEGHLENFSLRPTPSGRGPRYLVNQLESIYKELSTDQRLPVAISCAGPLDPVAGKFLTPANFNSMEKEWINFPLKDELKKKIQCEVNVENDAAASALGEYWYGNWPQQDHLLSITLGTGVGVGVISHGQLQRSAGGLHPELGHMVIMTNGESESEEKSLESFLGPKFFLSHLADKLQLEEFDDDSLNKHLRDKNAIVDEAMKKYLQILELGLANLFLVYGSRQIVFSGGFSTVLAPYLQTLEKKLHTRLTVFSRSSSDLPVLNLSNLSRTAGLYGAAYAFFRS